MNEEDITKLITKEVVSDFDKIFQEYGIQFCDEDGNPRSTYNILMDFAKFYWLEDTD